MATTTNYGWTTPDDTALVKDGAAAIRTLGSSVDTTTKALNPSTTLGDIEYRSSTANTNTRLGIGTTGQILTVAAGVPSWGAAPTSGGMTLISTTTLSGTSVTLSSIPQTYNDLHIIVSGMTANTSNKRLRGLPNNSTTNSTYSRIEGGGSAVQTTAGVLLLLGDLNTLRTSASNVVFLTIKNYASTTQFKSINWYGEYTSADYGALPIYASGAIVSNTAITSFVLDYEGTNTFAGGEVLLYGVK